MNRKVDSSVENDDIATFTEGRDDRGDGREILCVYDARLGTEERSDVLLEVEVDV